MQLEEWHDVLPFLRGHALIRELHVYGEHTGISRNSEVGSQHKGLGTKLLNIAEEIAFTNGYKNISIISGIGVKPYYRKKGYSNYNTDMSTEINIWCFRHMIIDNVCFILGILLIILSVLCAWQV